jgi:hypothetical protein
VAYIGSSLPSDDIPFVHRKFKPDVLLTYVTVPLNRYLYNNLLMDFLKHFPVLKIIVGGFQMNDESLKLPRNVERINSMEDLMRVM